MLLNSHTPSNLAILLHHKLCIWYNWLGSKLLPAKKMPDALAMMKAYILTRWLCGYCGVYERGVQGGHFPVNTCPQCGRGAQLQATVPGMTMTPLPFNSRPRDPTPGLEGRDVAGRKGAFPTMQQRRRGGTGRPKAKSLPTINLPTPPKVRLPGDQDEARGITATRYTLNLSAPRGSGPSR